MFLNPIMKHHRTGRHSDHIVISNISEDSEALAEAYNEDFDNDRSYEELTELGDGEIPYLFQVKVAGWNTTHTYDYILFLNSVSREEFVETANKYQLDQSQRPSSGFYPDIAWGIVLITADQLKTTPDKLSDENKKPVDAQIIDIAISEIYGDEDG